MTSKRLAAIGLGVGLLAGSGAALVVNLPGGAGASSGPVVVSSDDATATTDTTAPGSWGEPGDRMRDLLAPLVADGTLTDEQVEAIIDEIQSRRPAGPPDGRHGPGGWRGHRGAGPVLSTAAEVIGISADDLRAALAEGQTLAEVAQANGVDPQRVIDALVAEAEQRITTMVNEGPQHLVPGDETGG